MSITRVQYAGMNCKPMIISMRVGRRGRRRPRKRGKGLQMPFVRVNTCMSRFILDLKTDGTTSYYDYFES